MAKSRTPDLFGGGLEILRANQMTPENRDSIRIRAWREGKRIIRKLMGCSEMQAGARFTRLLKLARDDCSIVLAACMAAEDLQPLEPMAWLVKAVTIKARDAAASARIGLDWDLVTPEDLDANAARLMAQKRNESSEEAVNQPRAITYAES